MGSPMTSASLFLAEGSSLLSWLALLHLLNRFKQVAEEDEQVNQDFISWPLDLEVLKEHINPEVLEGLLDHINIL